jgi:transposase InsO family protein
MPPIGDKAVVSDPLDLITSDVCGPITPRDRDFNSVYLIGFVDAFTSFKFVVPSPDKSGDSVLRVFNLFVAAYGAPSVLQTDNGGEYVNRAMDARCRELGIARRFTAPYSPHQNGKMERSWGTIFGMVRAMLAWAGLPNSLWASAATHAVWLLNRSPQSGCQVADVVPAHAMLGARPDIGHLRVWGCVCHYYVHVRDGKLARRGSPAVFLGYLSGVRGWTVLCARTGRVLVSRSVRFLEDRPGSEVLKCSPGAPLDMRPAILPVSNARSLPPNQPAIQLTDESEDVSENTPPCTHTDEGASGDVEQQPFQSFPPVRSPGNIHFLS